jgi:hypothetical protein
MRHLLALLTLAFALVACDESTTGPGGGNIPGPPSIPRLTLTVLTGTKDMPVDSPTVKAVWAYTVETKVRFTSISSHPDTSRFPLYRDSSFISASGEHSIIVKTWCYDETKQNGVGFRVMPSDKEILNSIPNNGNLGNAGVTVYCK